MYKHDVKEFYLAEGVTIPTDAGTAASYVTGNAILSGDDVAGAMGGIGIKARVSPDADVSLTNTKTLTIALQGGETAEATSFSTIFTLAAVTADSTDFRIRVGEELGTFVLPQSPPKYLRVTIDSDDTAPSGAVDVYPYYLPR